MVDQHQYSFGLLEFLVDLEQMWEILHKSLSLNLTMAEEVGRVVCPYWVVDNMQTNCYHLSSRVVSNWEVPEGSKAVVVAVEAHKALLHR